LDEHVDVIGHDYKSTQNISREVKMEKRVLYQFARSCIPEWAFTMPSIQIRMHLAGEDSMEFDTVRVRENFKALVPVWFCGVDAPSFKP
jgi:hypothetical protein